MKLLILLNLIVFSSFAESEAFRHLKISCEKRNIKLACYNLARLYSRKNKLEMSDRFYKMGCKLGHKPSCNKEDKPYITKAPKRKISSIKIKEYSATNTTDLKNIINDVKNNKENLDSIAKMYCEQGVEKACLSLKCNGFESKDPQCKKNIQENLKKGFQYINNPEMFKKLAEDNLSPTDQRIVEPHIEKIIETKKRCKNTMKCKDRKLMLTMQQSLLVLSEYFIKVDISKMTKSCKSGNSESCYFKKVLIFQQESTKALRSISSMKI